MKDALTRWGLSTLEVIAKLILIPAWLVLVFAICLVIWIALLMNCITRPMLGVELFMKKRG